MVLLLLPEITIISIRNGEFTTHDTNIFPDLLWWCNLIMFLALHPDLTLQNVSPFRTSHNNALSLSMISTTHFDNTHRLFFYSYTLQLLRYNIKNVWVLHRDLKVQRKDAKMEDSNSKLLNHSTAALILTMKCHDFQVSRNPRKMASVLKFYQKKKFW